MAGSVLVTGASTGIGEATALYLDHLGFRVFAGVRQQSAADALRAQGSEHLTPLLLDVTSEQSIEAAAKTVESGVGSQGLVGLVNNAGISVAGTLEFLDLDELRRQLEVNLVGVVAVVQAFLPMVRQATGRVVNVGSIAGFNAGPFLGPYSASKYAIEAVTDSLRRELRGSGMNVSLIQPGSIDTAIWGKGLSYAEEVRSRASEQEIALYGDKLDAMTDFMTGNSKRAIPPQKVAESVHHALTARRPRTRYRVGTDAQLMRLLTWSLPDRAVDAILARVIGLPK